MAASRFKRQETGLRGLRTPHVTADDLPYASSIVDVSSPGVVDIRWPATYEVHGL